MSQVTSDFGAEDGIWDTHHHIFDRDRFPYSADRHLTPPKASIKSFQEFKSRHGIRHSVLVQGLSYGHDNSSLKAFVSQLGKKNTRGVAVIDRQTTNQQLEKLHQCGVRGIRLNLYIEQAMRDAKKQKEMLIWYSNRIKHLGWSVGFLQLEPRNWHHLSEVIPTLPVHVVVDHYALMKAPSMLPAGMTVSEQEGMAAIVKLLKGGNFWVKLSAPYRCSEAPSFDDMEELVKLLVRTNPRRVVWGSDWPHTPRMKIRSKEEALCEAPYLDIDDQSWLARLQSWLTEDERRMVMVDNPKVLYGW